MKLKYLVIIFSIFITITRCAENDIDFKKSWMKKIQDEYQEYLKTKFDSNPAPLTTLYMMVYRIADQMKIDIPNLYITICEADERISKFSGRTNNSIVATSNVGFLSGSEKNLDKVSKLKLKLLNIFNYRYIHKDLEKITIICIGSDQLKTLSFDELEAIIAHELGHIKLIHSIKLNNTVATIKLISLLPIFYLWLKIYNSSDSIKKKIFSALISYLIPSTLVYLIGLKEHRRYEFEADEEAYKFIKNKDNLINALKKMNKLQWDYYHKSTLYKADIRKLSSFGKLFFRFYRNWVTFFLNLQNSSSIFNSHPSIEERDKNLEKITV